MEIKLNTSIDGFFKYKIYRETPDNIIYESPLCKNLILNSGLAHLYTYSVKECINVIDFGISEKIPHPTDTGIINPGYNGSSLFTNLCALSAYSTVNYNNNTSRHVSFFRTNTTLRELKIREFAIKPAAFSDAFARQLLTIDLSGGDGIEFTYQVDVTWPCGIRNTDMQFEYRVGLDGNEYNADQGGLSTSWTGASAIENINWRGIVSNGSTAVAVASANTDNLEYKTNLMVSRDGGDYWTDIKYEYTSYPLLSSSKFNSVAYGFDNNLNINRFVAVGPGNVAASNTSDTLWISAAPAKYNNWTDITYGRSLVPPYVGTFVAVANTGVGRVMKSSTGVDWLTADNTKITNNLDWSSIAYGPVGGFVAINRTLTAHQIAYSTSGSNWLSAAAPEACKWESIAYGGGKYVAVASTGVKRIMYAFENDLTKWYLSPISLLTEWKAITYGDGIFVALGDSGASTRSIFSYDAINWLKLENLPEIKWSNITYSKDYREFLAIATTPASGHSVFYGEYALPRYPKQNIPLASSLLHIPKDGRIFSRNYKLYTLSGINLPTTCSDNYYTSLNYSTTFESNSYANSTTIFTYPNEVKSTFIFDFLSGYGPIKSFVLTDGRVQREEFFVTDLEGNEFLIQDLSIKNAVWGFDWLAPSILNDTTAKTGDPNNPITVVPRPGSLVKPFLANNQSQELLKLVINITNTWATSVPDVVGPTTIKPRGSTTLKPPTPTTTTVRPRNPKNPVREGETGPRYLELALLSYFTIDHPLLPNDLKGALFFKGYDSVIGYGMCESYYIYTVGPNANEVIDETSFQHNDIDPQQYYGVDLSLGMTLTKKSTLLNTTTNFFNPHSELTLSSVNSFNFGSGDSSVLYNPNGIREGGGSYTDRNTLISLLNRLYGDLIIIAGDYYNNNIGLALRDFSLVYDYEISNFDGRSPTYSNIRGEEFPDAPVQEIVDKVWELVQHIKYYTNFVRISTLIDRINYSWHYFDPNLRGQNWPPSRRSGAFLPTNYNFLKLPVNERTTKNECYKITTRTWSLSDSDVAGGYNDAAIVKIYLRGQSFAVSNQRTLYQTEVSYDEDNFATYRCKPYQTLIPLYKVGPDD